MIIEVCNKCNNTVVGEFSPGATRKWMTALAKKGGMKAVLTAAGSVIPGFGNITGFLAGTAIDVIYGKDINKLIDKIADEFDDNKIYVFTCPNCGNRWSRKEEDIVHDENFSETSNSTSYSVRNSSDYEDNAHERFAERFDTFLEKVDNAIENRNDAENLAREMELYAGDIESANTIVASQYYYLAGICMLLYVKQHYADKDTKPSVSIARRYLKKAYRLFDDGEYRLMLTAADTLSCLSPKQCIKESIETTHYSFQNGTLFKEDWLIEIYEECRFLSIIHADRMIDEAEEGKYDDDIRVKLWKAGLSLQDKDYRMICYLNISIHCTDRKAGEKVSLEEAEALNAVVNTQGYSIENCDVNNFYDRGWLEGCVYLAQSIIQNENPYVDTDIKEQFNILERISDFVGCFAGILACKSLGLYYEEGIVIEKNISKALSYYKKAGSEEDIHRLMAESKTSFKTVSSSFSSSISDSEAEYLEEFKECFENGVLSNGERRLLEKLRVKLGISESRATELKASLLRSQLTVEEQEYLSEYNECFRERGVITSGERRLLNKLRMTLGLSESRAEELEKIN